MLARERPHTVFAEVPSIALGLVALLMSRLLGFKVVVDAHNAVFENAETFPWPAAAIYRFIVRHADLVIVTNEAVAERARKLKGRPFILPDPVPGFEPGAAVSGSNDVVVISTWAEDEPLQEILLAAGSIPDSLRMTITGKPKGKYGELAKQTAKINVPGFLPDQAYVSLLRNARVIVDLTTREDCLVCGAYEALAVGRPLVVSDTRALRSLLREGAVYCENQAASIAQAITFASHSEQEMSSRCSARRESYLREWKEAARALLQMLSQTGLRVHHGRP
jgi:glycosyltransferase involved in cell wall biosynthesis